MSFNIIDCHQRQRVTREGRRSNNQQMTPMIVDSPLFSNNGGRKSRKRRRGVTNDGIPKSWRANPAKGEEEHRSWNPKIKVDAQQFPGTLITCKKC
jgi:hypothetical protein